MRVIVVGLTASAVPYAICATARAQIFETNVGNGTIGEDSTARESDWLPFWSQYSPCSVGGFDCVFFDLKRESLIVRFRLLIARLVVEIYFEKE